MEFKIPLSNTSNQQSGPEDNWLEGEYEAADALLLLSVPNKSLKDDMETKSDTERDSENVKIAQVVRNRRSKQSEAEEFILAALTLAKFSGRCKNYREREIRAVLGNTPNISKALRK
uniref:HTH three-helical bundle domain-containing protein n=1 Tax=Fagus sylvatica TaxID=28930 RepID=A0A2N9FQ67_FAGSY